jgi:hypothetical protein
VRNWIKTLFFLSSFSPTLLVLAYVRYDIHGIQTDVYQLIAIAILGLIIPMLILKLISTSSEKITFEAKKVESNDFLLFVFVFSYISPLIARVSEVNVMVATFITAVLVFILWITSDIPSHPLLRVLKFRFYKAESSGGVVFTLISKRNIRDPKTIKMVKQLSSNMLMEAE